MDSEDTSGFAPFDLSKTRKFDRNTDKQALCKNFYKSASLYYDAARYLLVNLDLMPVTLSNIAFSCELFLKAILYGFGIDFNNTHGLKNLFELLPKSERTYIANNIAIKDREKEFPLCLHEQNRAFIEYRYMCEAKAITSNPVFLFAFADILKFVYESLVKENAKSSTDK